jgi:outer membrane protein
MKKLILTTGISFFTVTFLFSQTEILTYEEVVHIAVENNITIKQQQNNLKVNKANRQQSVANFLPDISINGGGYRTDGRQWSNEESTMINTSIDRANYSIGANITVFDGLKNIYRLKQSNNLLEAQKEQLEQSKQHIIYLVSQQFIQILLDKELVLIAEQDVEVQRKLYEQIKIYVKTGARTKTELLSQEAQLKTSKANFLSLNNQLRRDRANLAKTLLLESEKEIDVLQPDWNIENILNTNYDMDALHQIALNSRPELKRLQAEEKANLNDVVISRSDYMPKINIFYNYGSHYSSDYYRLNPYGLYQAIAFESQLLRENNTHQYGFSINIPIFDRLQTRTNVIRTKIKHENSKLEFQNFKMQLFIDVQNAYQDLASCKEVYFANLLSAEASRLAHEKQQEMYRMGQGSLIDLSIENRRKIEAQFEAVQAKYNLFFQQIVLNYHIGNINSTIFIN